MLYIEPGFKIWKMLAGKGIRAISVMWAMTLISFILIPLRLYTRIYIVKGLGVDDHVFNMAWVGFLSHSIYKPTKADLPGLPQYDRTLT